MRVSSPQDHWTHQDGGRIIGEACHIVDPVGALTNSRIMAVNGESMDGDKSKFTPSDNKSILLKYEDGSVAHMEYLSMGNRSMPKEYMEIHFDEKSIVLDDYRQLRSFGFRIRPIASKVSNKGHLEELKVLFDHLNQKKQEWPIDWENLVETTRTSFTIA